MSPSTYIMSYRFSIDITKKNYILLNYLKDYYT